MNRDEVDINGWTSLHCAVYSGHLEITKLLMVYGADLNARTYVGQLPIDMDHHNNEKIKQAIRDEPRRRIDQAPSKRCIDNNRQSSVFESTFTPQEDKEEEDQYRNPPADGEESNEGMIADEDQDSEPSSDEEDDKWK